MGMTRVSPTAHPLVHFTAWVLTPVLWMAGLVKSIFVHNRTPLQKALLPFTKMQESVTALETAARAEEQKLRASASKVLEQADHVSKQVQQAAAVNSKLIELLSPSK